MPAFEAVFHSITVWSLFIGFRLLNFPLICLLKNFPQILSFYIGYTCLTPFCLVDPMIYFISVYERELAVYLNIVEISFNSKAFRRNHALHRSFFF